LALDPVKGKTARWSEQIARYEQSRHHNNRHWYAKRNPSSPVSPGAPRNDLGRGRSSRRPYAGRHSCGIGCGRDRRALAGIELPLQALEVRSQFRRALAAQFAIFLECLVDDCFKL
jgi:hypothetical protein